MQELNPERECLPSSTYSLAPHPGLSEQFSTVNPEGQETERLPQPTPYFSCGI
jgi:hypothetical protein